MLFRQTKDKVQERERMGTENSKSILDGLTSCIYIISIYVDMKGHKTQAASQTRQDTSLDIRLCSPVPGCPVGPPLTEVLNVLWQRWHRLSLSRVLTDMESNATRTSCFISTIAIYSIPMHKLELNLSFQLFVLILRATLILPVSFFLVFSSLMALAWEIFLI